MSAAETRTPFCLEGIDLAGVQSPSGMAGVKVRLFPDTSILRIIPFRSRRQNVETALTRFGFDSLPSSGRFRSIGDYRLAWASQNCWHLMCSPAVETLEQDLKQAFEGAAAISSAGDGLLRMEIEGRDAGTLMAKGCVLDLDHFLPGHCAVTLMAHTRLYLHRVSATGYQLLIPASHAASFWEWLAMSAAEFGMAVGDVPAD